MSRVALGCCYMKRVSRSLFCKAVLKSFELQLSHLMQNKLVTNKHALTTRTAICLRLRVINADWTESSMRIEHPTMPIIVFQYKIDSSQHNNGSPWYFLFQLQGCYMPKNTIEPLLWSNNTGIWRCSGGCFDHVLNRIQTLQAVAMSSRTNLCNRQLSLYSNIMHIRKNIEIWCIYSKYPYIGLQRDNY